jgi:pre-rRNA-processing protein TSR4
MNALGNQSKRLETVVQLGFSVDFEDDEHRLLAGHHLPLWRDWDGGQLGGRPTWLNPKDIPQNYLTCKCCQEPMVFVCQLYAPCEEVNPDAFHRSFYVFACPNSNTDKNCEKQTTGTIRVLRAQLPRVNPYFPEDQDESWVKHKPESWNVSLCIVCGQRGHGKCPIQNHDFCGKHHQKEHKKFVFDKQNHLSKEIPFKFLPSVLTASELVVEEEPFGKNDDRTRDKVERALFKAQGIEVEGEDDFDSDDEDGKLEQNDLNEITGAAAETVTKDSFTMKFYERINNAEDVKSQCLRYLRWPDESTCLDTGTPLWIRSDFQPESIPSCELCGASRKFEFQLMPQMLHYLLKDLELERAKEEVKTRIKKEDVEAIKTATSIIDQAPPEQVPPDFAASKEKAVDAMRAKLLREDENRPDWGVVAIYSCTDSCDGTRVREGSELGAYMEEYAWKQPALD